MSGDYQVFTADQLRAFEVGVLTKLGLSEEDARIAADTLTSADLMGVDSHGIAHFADGKGYVLGLKEGIINAKARPRVVRETAATALLDGDNGLGIVNASKAMKLAIKKAESAGAGFVSVTNSRHLGMAAHYPLMAVEHDMIGIAMTNTIPGVTPAGGAERKLGTNPIAVAVPAGEEVTFSLDIATSAVANGKLELARIRGESIPEGWAVDKDGNPTTDPFTTTQGGMLLPLGSFPTLSNYKGYGLGLMVDIFSGVLSGLGYCRMIDLGTYQMGHFLGAWRIDAFRDVDEFKAMMDNMIREMHATKPAPGSKGVLVPGEREYHIRKERERNGIPIHKKIIAPLIALGEEMGVQFPV